MKKLMSPQVMRTELRQALARLDVPDQHLDATEWRTIAEALRRTSAAASKYSAAADREAGVKP